MERTIKDRKLAYRQKVKIRSIIDQLSREEHAGEILATLTKAYMLIDGYTEPEKHADTQEQLL